MDCLDYRALGIYYLARDNLSGIYRELGDIDNSNRRLIGLIKKLFDNCV